MSPRTRGLLLVAIGDPEPMRDLIPEIVGRGATLLIAGGPQEAVQMLTAHAGVRVQRLVRTERLEVSLDHHVATWDGRLIDLTPSELRLLFLLAKGSGAVCTFEEMCSAAWGGPHIGDTGALRSSVKRLRRKLQASSTLDIESIRGVGYRLVSPDERS